jgi:hypothetical protein
MFGRACPECGQNRGTNPSMHVCNQEAFIAHQTSKGAKSLEKLEEWLGFHLESNEGRFTDFLIRKKKL